MAIKIVTTEGEIWQPISDLMSVLMMVFILIAVSFMLEISVDRDEIKDVAESYITLQEELYNELYQEFKDDLVKWHAELDKESISIRFKSPEILFDNGSSEIKPEFEYILTDFFPRFTRILYDQKYRADIEEIRIEGHTSKYWSKTSTVDQAYILNMRLSQDRTRNVLELTMGLIEDSNKSAWVRMNLTANGLSSSKPIVESNGEENQELSRRVEFRVKTNAESKINEILASR